MRRLIVLRHAKSAWPDGVADDERPLAARGLRDAPRAGRWLARHGFVPDRVVCSTARRTRETWRIAGGALGVSPPVAYDERLYGAGLGDFLAVVGETGEEVGTLLVVGHEPGVSEVTVELAGSADGDALVRVRTKFPTCALAVLELPGPWRDVAADTAVLRAFVVPRDPAMDG
ncbi:SixA phosphatase family protein [Amycolatopsis sp. NPDC059021]|uniref:SixA phosphatase family protein n=1 Tax=Amycolatopsis sp. NPDC059021 TaxID=3346704 RepID=UPI00366F20F3